MFEPFDIFLGIRLACLLMPQFRQVGITYIKSYKVRYLHVEPILYKKKLNNLSLESNKVGQF